MLVRSVRPDDFDSIAVLTNHFILGTPIHFGYEPVTATELRDAWQRHADRFPFLVAEFDGAFAGYAKAGTWRERTAYSWIVETGIYVRPDFQGRGVGRGLYRALLDTLRAQGFHAAIGGITLPNPASVRLHEATGFVHVGTVRRAGWKFNAWHDVGFWQVLLRDPDHRAEPPAPPPPVPDSNQPASPA